MKRLPILCVVLGLICTGIPVVLYAESAFEPPANIKALIKEQKIDDASRALTSLIDTMPENDRLGALKLLFQTETDVNRLTQSFEKWLAGSRETAVRTFLIRSLGQLFLELRDFRSAAAVYDQGGPVGEFLIASGRLYLLLGNADEARNRFAMVLSSHDKSLVENAASGLSWIYWSEGDPKKAYEIVKNQTGAASLTLQCLIARSLGQTKDELAAIERLRTNYPRSVWLSLVDNHNDPALQMDSLLLVLTGIGPAASGAFRPVKPVPKTEAGLTAKSEKIESDESATAKAIQVGTFKSVANARKLSDKLKAKGFMTQVEEEKGSANNWKVMVLVRPGQDSQTLLIQLKDAGVEGFLVF